MSDIPIGDYALLGDTRTAALTSRGGAIDWFCVPKFDSDPIFARLLTGDQGSTFAITPTNLVRATRAYRPSSAILETTWNTTTGAARLTEGIVLEVSGALLPEALLVRRLECTGGRIEASVLYHPLLGLPGRPPRSQRRSPELVCTWGSLALSLGTTPHLALTPGKPTDIKLEDGQYVCFALAIAERGPLVFIDPERVRRTREERCVVARLDPHDALRGRLPRGGREIVDHLAASHL